jgi:signal transduction histidine kinase/DNA-binding response OmpR family regulator
MKNPNHTRSVPFLQSFPRIASVSAILVGCWVLAGWNFDIPILQIGIAAHAGMTANAALAFVLAGISLWLLRQDSPDPAGRRMARICALCVALIGLLTLCEQIFATDLGIDNLLYRQFTAIAGASIPRRMSSPNAINLTLIGIALLLLTARTSRAEWLSRLLALAAAVSPALALGGRLHNIPTLYTMGADVEIPSVTAATIILVSCGIIRARPREGLRKMIAIIRYSLVPQVIALVVLAVLLGGGIVSLIMVRQNQQALRENIIADNMTAADLTAEFAWRFMEGAMMSLRGFSTSEPLVKAVVTGNFSRTTPDLQRFLKSNTRLEICALFDENGIAQAAGAIPPAILGSYSGDREWYQHAMVTRKPYVGIPMFSRLTGRPIVPYAIPILDREGKVHGVLMGGISITELSQAISSIRTGQRVRASIADKRMGGMILAHPDRSRILQPVSGKNEAGRRAINGERGSIETHDTTGELVLASYAPVPNLPWGVLVLQPSRAAFASVAASVDRSMLYVAVLLLFAAGISGWLASKVTRPLVHLREAATALAEGRRSAPINLTRQDELGDLGRAFDHMAVALAERTTQLEAANQDLGEQNRRIQQADRLKSEFLANMSHELRTPLNAIIGFAEIMHDGKVGPISSQHKEYLGDVLTSARHLLQLINDILDLSKVEAGKIEFRPQRVDLEVAVQEACAIVRALAAKKRIALRSKIDASLSHINTDPRSLKQILYNYLSNALKFTPEGGVVTVRAKAAGADHFRIEVEDNGIGIRAADRERLFVEFQQLDASVGKKYSGTGLGLALTKKIAEAQGGYVEVNSTFGKGSTFCAVLPQVLRASDKIVEETTSATMPAAAPLVLVIANAAESRARIAEPLRNGGFAVDTVATGLEAVACCHQSRFDAILLDLRLPDMSGRAVFEKLRERGFNQQTPVLVTIFADRQETVIGFRVNDILALPLSENKFLDAVERSGLAPGDSRPILVVDDDSSTLHSANELLRRAGYTTVCRRDAASALTIATREPPAAIILDPVGAEFLKEFRRTATGRSTPVIICAKDELTGPEPDKIRAGRSLMGYNGACGYGLIDELTHILSNPRAKLQSVSAKAAPWNEV